MKTYVITLSRNFPAGHPKAGEPTNFRDKFLNKQKVHTIRGNYELWKARLEEVKRGEAALSIREWTGAPYRSPQAEIRLLTAADGVSVQRLEFLGRWIVDRKQILETTEALEIIAGNDGLEYKDWEAWFAKADKTKPFAIIHFTPYRYE